MPHLQEKFVEHSLQFQSPLYVYWQASALKYIHIYSHKIRQATTWEGNANDRFILVIILTL